MARTAIRRCFALVTVVAAALLATAPAVIAADGVGLAGRTDDRLITFFCFGVIAFFAILVTVLSLIQMRLDARKDQRKTELERIGG